MELHEQRSLYRLDQGQQVGENHFHDFYIRVGLHIANLRSLGGNGNWKTQWVWNLRENAMGWVGGWIGFSVNRI